MWQLPDIKHWLKLNQVSHSLLLTRPDQNNPTRKSDPTRIFLTRSGPTHDHLYSFSYKISRRRSNSSPYIFFLAGVSRRRVMTSSLKRWKTQYCILHKAMFYHSEWTSRNVVNLCHSNGSPFHHVSTTFTLHTSNSFILVTWEPPLIN